MTQTLFLTGRPGVGKTTVIKIVAQALGKWVDGFYTEELREDGERQGFRLRGLRGGRGTLAHVQWGKHSLLRVGHYGINVTALEQVGVVALRRGVARGRIIIIDEIGKMELFSEAFKAATLAAIDDPTPVIATVMAQSHPWVDALKARPDVQLWEVTFENRDEMPAQVLEWVHPRHFVSSTIEP